MRNEDGLSVKASDIEYVAKWDITAAPQEINMRPARVLLQDFTGVPCVVGFGRHARCVAGDGPRTRRRPTR